MMMDEIVLVSACCSLGLVDLDLEDLILVVLAPLPDILVEEGPHVSFSSQKLL